MERKIPISPFEVIRRMKEVPKILEWSRKKHLIVSGPEFWGTHHIYIGTSLKHCVFLLKADLTTHVLIGNVVKAEEWRKYDKDFKLLLSEKLKKHSLEWKIYQDIVLYKGKSLPPKKIPEEPYWGKVISAEEFSNGITDEWIVSTIKEYYKK